MQDPTASFTVFHVSEHRPTSPPDTIEEDTLANIRALTPYKVQNWLHGFISTGGIAVLRWVGT